MYYEESDYYSELGAEACREMQMEAWQDEMAFEEQQEDPLRAICPYLGGHCDLPSKDEEYDLPF